MEYIWTNTENGIRYEYTATGVASENEDIRVNLKVILTNKAPLKIKDLDIKKIVSLKNFSVSKVDTEKNLSIDKVEIVDGDHTSKNTVQFLELHGVNMLIIPSKEIKWESIYEKMRYSDKGNFISFKSAQNNKFDFKLNYLDVYSVSVENSDLYVNDLLSPHRIVLNNNAKLVTKETCYSLVDSIESNNSQMLIEGYAVATNTISLRNKSEMAVSPYTKLTVGVMKQDNTSSFKILKK